MSWLLFCWKNSCATRTEQPLVEQLKVGGRLILPVGDQYQELLRLTRTERGVHVDTLLPVRFVPMTGRALEDQFQR